MTRISNNVWASTLTFQEQRAYVSSEADQQEAYWLLRRLQDVVEKAQASLVKQISRKARLPG